jgi:hypothetical protein
MKNITPVLLMLVGSSLSLVLYCALFAYVVFDYYFSGIREPLPWSLILHWPSVFQTGIFVTLGALVGASLYILRGGLNVWRGRQMSFLLTGVCSLATAPLGLLSLLGLCLAYRKQIKTMAG